MAALDQKTLFAIFVTIVIVVIALTCASMKGNCLPKFSKSSKSSDAEDAEDAKSPGAPGCFSENTCQPSMEAFYPHSRRRQNPYALPKHDPGHDIYGYSLNNNYCRYGLGQEGIVDGENDLWRFQIYTVQPSMTNLKFQKVMM